MTANSQPISWILFDLSGVLVPFTFVRRQWYEYKSRFFEAKELEGIFYDKDYAACMKGELSHEQAVGRYIHKKHIDLTVDEFNELIHNDQQPMEGMVELLQTLAPLYKIAVATNEGKVTMQYKIEASGAIPYLTKIVPSYLLRSLKPEKDFYVKLLSRIHARPEECIFIDDTKRNIEAAELLGIRSILFTNTKQLESDLVQLQILH
jgi:HAD superfamily hydrolase (TIGR01509 family)